MPLHDRGLGDFSAAEIFEAGQLVAREIFDLSEIV